MFVYGGNCSCDGCGECGEGGGNRDRANELLCEGEIDCLSKELLTDNSVGPDPIPSGTESNELVKGTVIGVE